MRNCPHCNNGVDEHATVCPHCQGQLESIVKPEDSPGLFKESIGVFESIKKGFKIINKYWTLPVLGFALTFIQNLPNFLAGIFFPEVLEAIEKSEAAGASEELKNQAGQLAFAAIVDHWLAAIIVLLIVGLLCLYAIGGFLGACRRVLHLEEQASNRGLTINPNIVFNNVLKDAKTYLGPVTGFLSIYSIVALVGFGIYFVLLAKWMYSSMNPSAMLMAIVPILVFALLAGVYSIFLTVGEVELFYGDKHPWRAFKTAIRVFSKKSLKFIGLDLAVSFAILLIALILLIPALIITFGLSFIGLDITDLMVQLLTGYYLAWLFMSTFIFYQDARKELEIEQHI